MNVNDNRGRDEQVAGDDVIIEIEGQDKPRVETDRAASQDDTAGGDDLSALKNQVADANARAEQEGKRATAAETRAEEWANRARSEYSARFAAQEGMVDNAITACQTDIAALNKDLAEAIERGDVKAQVDINDKLMDVKINLRAHSGAKQKLTQLKERMVKQAEAQARGEGNEDGGNQPQRGQQQDQDPLAGYSPQARQWIERWRDDKGNVRFLTDQKFYRKVIAGHEDALAEGYAEGSPEYFGYIEKFAKLVSDEDGDQDYQEQERVTKEPERLQRQPTQRQSSAAAPPSRGNGDGRTRTDTRERIRLTAEEAAFAETQSSLGATREERLRNYGINKQKARANGELLTQRAS